MPAPPEESQGIKQPEGQRLGTTQRAQRNPMPGTWNDGGSPAATAKTPACEPSSQEPPRNNAPGPFVDPPPAKQTKSLPGRPSAAESVQPVVLRSAQSATHSSTLPIMSNTPQLDLQFIRLPVFDGPPLVLQSLGPGVSPGSGVPAAASCHSRFVVSRFP